MEGLERLYGQKAKLFGHFWPIFTLGFCLENGLFLAKIDFCPMASRVSESVQNGQIDPDLTSPAPRQYDLFFFGKLHSIDELGEF